MLNTMNILAGKTAKPPQLSPQRKRFADALLAGMNQTTAAIEAGYSDKTASVQGSSLLRIPLISEYIAFYQAKIAERNKITQDEIVTGIREVIDRLKATRPYQSVPLLKGYELLAKMAGFLRDQGIDPEQRPSFVGINITMGNGTVKMTRTNTAQNATNKQIGPTVEISNT